MSYVNKFDNGGKCSIMGVGAENRFDEVIKSLNYVSTKSTSNEDMYHHIDRYVEMQGHKFSVDVKAQKKTNRHDKSLNSEEIWIEIKNVSGNDGWVHGKADFIAFERDDYDFLLVKRKDVVSLYESKVDSAQVVSSANDALYKIYRRAGRNDILTRVKLSDLESIKNRMEIQIGKIKVGD